MRVSENTAFNKAVHYVQKSKQTMEKAQEKVGSLKRLNRPSDDPIGMVRLLKMRSEKGKIRDMNTNLDSGKSLMNVADGVLSQATEIIIRAKELALQQAGDIGSTHETRKAVSEEIGQLYRQLLKIANTQVGGRYIFAGFMTNIPPFNLDGKYEGDNGEIFVEMSDTTNIPINIPGNTLFQGVNRSDGEAGVDIFKVMKKLHRSLITNNKYSIQDSLDGLDESIGQLVFNRARFGARLNTLHRISEMHKDKEINTDDLISHVEDADVYKAVSDLRKNENILKTTLASASKVIQPSLLDFLR